MFLHTGWPTKRSCWIASVFVSDFWLNLVRLCSLGTLHNTPNTEKNIAFYFSWTHMNRTNPMQKCKTVSVGCWGFASLPLLIDFLFDPWTFVILSTNCLHCLLKHCIAFILCFCKNVNNFSISTYFLELVVILKANNWNIRIFSSNRKLTNKSIPQNIQKLWLNAHFTLLFPLTRLYLNGYKLLHHWLEWLKV